MSEALLPPVALRSPSQSVRIEYVGFRNAAEHREYRLRVYGREASSEFRYLIPFVAFGAGRVRLQDGPDVCYRMLLRAIEAGETASVDGITIDDAELASYRVARTPVVKRRPRPVPAPE